MHETISELVHSAAGVLVFAVFLLPPGFLAARLLNICGMRRRSREEQLLWSVALSVPLALLLAELLGRVLSPLAVLAVFCGLALLSIVLLLRRRSPQPSVEPGVSRRTTHLAYAAAAAWAVYALLAVLNVSFHHRLFLPTSMYDWSVRIPMMRAALRGPIPPLNPLSALAIVPPHLRYYYFWYVLCAEPARLGHLSAQAALSASTVWAGWALLAVTFLSLKYLVGLRKGLKHYCLLVLLPLLVIGLDILPTVVDMFRRSVYPHPEMEWWRTDRTPAFVTTLLYGPHHVAGLVCSFVAVLILLEVVPRKAEVEPTEQAAGSAATLPSAGFIASRALLAGCAFAACAGTSTFIAFIFALVCVLWGLDMLRRREWRPVFALLLTGPIAWLLSRPFLAEMRGGTSAAQGFATFAWRNGDFIHQFFVVKHVLSAHPLLALSAQQPGVLFMDFLELGFFAFVLLERVRTELAPSIRGRFPMSPGNRVLWAILAAAGLDALLVSSSVTQSVNDLGMHAGLIVRFVLVLWSVPYLRDLWERRKQRRDVSTTNRLSRRQSFVDAASALCLVLGLVGGLYSMALKRLYLPLIEAHVIRSPEAALTADGLSSRLFAIRETWQMLDASLPAGARVQFNPTGFLQPGMSLFSLRQIVASDTGCGTAFGGDYSRCAPVDAELHHLFASGPMLTELDGLDQYPPSATVPDARDFFSACSDLKLDAVMVDSSDPVWQQPDSWVWSLHPVIAGQTVRVFYCPKAPAPVHP